MAFKNLSELESAIRQALGSEFSPAEGSSPDITLKFTVVSYQPAVPKKETARERRMVKTGTNTSDEREVPVVYWEARGSLAIQVDIRDSGGTILENQFRIAGEHFQRVQTTVNGLSEVKDVTRSSSQSFLAALLLTSDAPRPTAPFVEPTPQALETSIISGIARQLQMRYTKSKSIARVQLAVPDPLRPGNELAMSGQWEKALASWSAAKINAKEDKGERDFNMATGNAAIFYQRYNASGDPAAFEPYYREAMRLYDSARVKDPKEEVYRDSVNGVTMTTEDFNRAKDQWDLAQRDLQRQEELARMREAQEKQQREQLTKDTDPTRPDTVDEAAFRRKARISIRDSGGEQNSVQRAVLLQEGQDLYRLSLAQAERVLSAETAHLQSLATYRVQYESMRRTGGAIDADERGVLTDLAARLKLETIDIAAIETPPEPRLPQPQVVEVKPQPPASGFKPTEPAPVKPAASARTTTQPVRPAKPDPAKAPPPAPTKVNPGSVIKQ